MTTDFSIWQGLTPADIDFAVADIQRQILVLAGRPITTSRGEEIFPEFPESFSELHDYTDANTLGGFCGVHDSDPLDEGVSDRSDWPTEVFAEVQERVHQWLVERHDNQIQEVCS